MNISWSEFIKKLLTLDVIFGARTKKLTGIPDSHKFYRGMISSDDSHIFFSDPIPNWVKVGTKFKIRGTSNNEAILSVKSISPFYLEVNQSILVQSEDLAEIDGRMSAFFEPNIARTSDLGTMFNVNQKGSGVSTANTNHFHKISDIFDPQFDSPETLGKLVLSQETHAIIVDKDGNPFYTFPSK